jgi:hypothetical protein
VADLAAAKDGGARTGAVDKQPPTGNRLLKGADMTDAPPIIIDEDAAIDSAFYARTRAELAMRMPTAAAGFWSCAKPLLSASRR